MTEFLLMVITFPYLTILLCHDSCNALLHELLCCPHNLAHCRELTTLWVVRLDDGVELKVTDPKKQQGDIEEEETKGEKRRDGVDCQGTSCWR